MNSSLVAGRYARALFEICRENHCIEDALRDMNRIRNILEEAPEIRQYCLQSQKVPVEENEFIDIAFLPYVTDFTKYLLIQLVKNGRLFSLPFLPAAFETIYNNSRNIVTVKVESAHELSESEIADIKNRMEARTGKNINVQTVILPEVLGGFRIMWQNRILDFTAKDRLREIKRLMSDDVH